MEIVLKSVPRGSQMSMPDACLVQRVALIALQAGWTNVMSVKLDLSLLEMEVNHLKTYSSRICNASMLMPVDVQMGRTTIHLSQFATCVHQVVPNAPT